MAPNALPQPRKEVHLISPTTILFAWELGQNAGHLTRDLPLARQLAQAGYHCIFAVRDTRIAAEVLGEEFPYVQAPVCTLPKPGWYPVNHADILYAGGFGDAAALTGLVKAWAMLFRLTEPALVIADHAPVALLAARAMGIAAMPLGTGFEVPPATQPFPLFGEIPRDPVLQMMNRSNAALHTANQLLHPYGQQPLKTLGDLYPEDKSLLLTSPILDHYGFRPNASYAGQTAELPQAHRVNWESSRPVKVFGYLRKNVQSLPDIVAALCAGSELETILAIPGISQAEAAAMSHPNVRVYSHLVALDTVLPEASMLITYGGHGIMAQALAARKPALVFATTVEQQLLAQRLERANVDVIAPVVPLQPGQILALIRKLSRLPPRQVSPDGLKEYSPQQVLAHIERLVTR